MPKDESRKDYSISQTIKKKEQPSKLENLDKDFPIMANTLAKTVVLPQSCQQRPSRLPGRLSS